MASEETSFRPVAISAAPMGAIAVLERLRELGRFGSANGCVCISGMPSTELGVTTVRAGWVQGSVALMSEGSSGAAWGGNYGGV